MLQNLMKALTFHNSCSKVDRRFYKKQTAVGRFEYCKMGRRNKFVVVLRERTKSRSVLDMLDTVGVDKLGLNRLASGENRFDRGNRVGSLAKMLSKLCKSLTNEWKIPVLGM